MGKEYFIIKCSRCGYLNSDSIKCPVCDNICKKIDIKQVKEPDTRVVNDYDVKKVDLGKPVLTKNEDNSLYNIEFVGSQIMGIFDLTLEELRYVKKLINKEIKRARSKR